MQRLRHYLATLAHKWHVARHLVSFAVRLVGRAVVHDLSKFREPEASRFAATLSELGEATYGSDEYEALRARLKEALDHHYAANSHHPEYHEGGIKGMPLIDVVEMWCDWKAAVRRHDDGDLHASIEVNQERFGYGDTLKSILHNSHESAHDAHESSQQHS